ncbi:transcriptional regulator GutM [Sporolactobacillus vineae]|uniref:transcriptional regulator GutM n=1 Tax=Sporolactobacillus vineae TaxID=444463 RepID=UPI0002880DE8|nr:transcriptional regulator GutM [Sporolactobacillus vineae]
MLFFTLMLFIGGAFLLQIFLGYFQMRHMSRVFIVMRRQGRVAIGRKRGNLRAGTIVFLAIDKNGKILDARKMQGVTILARFRELKPLIGEQIQSIDEKKVSVYNKLLRQAIADAVTNYRIVAEGGTIEENRSTPLSTTLIGIKSVFTGKFHSKRQKG